MLMYYQDAVYHELESLGISKSALEKGMLKIYTNLDMDKQKALEEKILLNMEGEKEMQKLEAANKLKEVRKKIK